MQLLHLEGPTDKESRLTAIPREKSRSNFVVQRGGNLYADGVSLIDTLPPSDNDTDGNGDKHLGEIIFEAGMDHITLSGSLRSELNQDFFKNQQQQRSMPQSQPQHQQPRSSSTSQHNDDHGASKPSQRHQSNTSSIRRNSKKDRSSTTTATAQPLLPLSSSKDTVNEVYEMEEVDNVFDANNDDESTTATDGKSIPMRILHHHNNKPSYEPLGSDSTVSSATDYVAAQKAASTRKGYIALDIDPGEAADTSDVDDLEYDEETPSSLFSGSDSYTTYRGGEETSRPSSSANTNARAGSSPQQEQKPSKDTTSGSSRTIKDSIIKKTGTGGVNVGKVGMWRFFLFIIIVICGGGFVF